MNGNYNNYGNYGAGAPPLATSVKAGVITQQGAYIPPTKADMNVLNVRHGDDFVINKEVEGLAIHALNCLKAGFPVHFSGATGTGKTSLALYVAELLGRPTVILHGDDEYKKSDFLGGNYGYRFKKTTDNFIHTVMKHDESFSKHFVDHTLSLACKNGYTLLYDEFSRSKPEANNVLLSILEEKLLGMPNTASSGTYLRVHPNFSAIFTSNPEEYAGVHKAQDALIDRMITIRLDYYSHDTEVAIVQTKSGLSKSAAELIVDMVSRFRKLCISPQRPTVRAGIMISKIGLISTNGSQMDKDTLCRICRDVLNIGKLKFAEEGKELTEQEIDKLLSSYCHRLTKAFRYNGLHRGGDGHVAPWQGPVSPGRSFAMQV